MNEVSGADRERIERAMRRSIVAGPCLFANAHAREKDGRIDWFTLGGKPSAELAKVLERSLDTDSAPAQRVAIVVFPELRCPEHVVDLLAALNEHPRWAVNLVSEEDHPHKDDCLVSLFWTTREQNLSSAMGLAPFGEMPVTRRAPYVALATYPGSHANERQKARKRMGFANMPVPDAYLGEKYDEAWDSTKAGTREVLSYPLDKSARHDVAFTLPGRCRPSIEALVAK